MHDATGTPLPHALCKHLCSKKLYMLNEARDVTMEDLQTAGYENYWCGHTNTDNGPDRGWVTFERCNPGRGCYEALDRSLSIGARIVTDQAFGTR